MHCTVKMTEDLYWVGASDRRLALFESVYPIPRGVSYNAYVLLDEKTVLLDTVDQSVAGQFFENLAHVLGGLLNFRRRQPVLLQKRDGWGTICFDKGCHNSHEGGRARIPAHPDER